MKHTNLINTSGHYIRDEESFDIFFERRIYSRRNLSIFMPQRNLDTWWQRDYDLVQYDHTSDNVTA